MSSTNVEELRKAAEPILLDAVRQQPLLHFTDRCTSISVHPKKIRKAMGMPKEDARDILPISGDSVCSE